MNSTLTPLLHAAEFSTNAPLRRAMFAAARACRFVLLMSQSGGGSQSGSSPGTPAPTDGEEKKKDDGQSTDGTKPMDPPTVQKKAFKA